MLFEYKCPECGTLEYSNERGDRLERECQGCHHSLLHRQFAVNLARPMMPHFNATVGKEITSMRGFKDELAKKGEEYTRQTGMEVNYQPLEPGDIKRPDDAGLDGTNRARHAAGLKEIK